MDEPLIRYKNVNINQQELGVLEDVNLELNKGEFVYLIGKSRFRQNIIAKNHLRRVGHSIGRRRSIRLQYEQYQAQAYPPTTPPIGNRFPGFPTADRPQCTFQSQFCATRHRMEQ